MVDLGFLKQAEVFSRLNDEELATVSTCCVEEEFQEGDKLFSEKEDAKHLWLLKEGLVDLRFDLPARPTAAENTISTLHPKMLIGWSSLVPPFKYTLSAYCTSRTCRVVKLDTAALVKMFQKDNRMGYIVTAYLLRVIASRFELLRNSAIAKSCAI
ncbi:MAG: Crp/Fnr family transcriptional regulator [Thermodesulfobacteriota bacterium]